MQYAERPLAVDKQADTPPDNRNRLALARGGGICTLCAELSPRMSVDVSNQVEVRSYPRRGLHAADARAATRDIMRSWHVTGEPADDVTLVVSELIGNAVRHAFGPVVILTLTLIRLRPEIAHPSTCTY